MSQKTMDILTGSEESGNWSVRIKIGVNELPSESYFWVADATKVRMRSSDRAYFKKYGGSLLEKYEIHHDWDKDGVCFLLTHAQHLKLKKKIER